VVIDWLGAGYGSTVLVSTDGDIARQRYGNTTPARMVVAGIVDQVQARAPERREDGMRLGIVRGHVTLTPAVPELLGLTLVVLEPVTMANLRAKNGLGGGKSLIAVDALGAAKGQMVALRKGPKLQIPSGPKKFRWMRIAR
jgi:microcompartment protein CcmK/EutM